MTLRKKQFSKKYIEHVSKQSPSWLRRRWVCFALLLRRDCICPLLPAHHAEHLHYRNLGHEWPLRDIVPPNRNTHKFVTWLKDVLQGFRPINCWMLRGCYAFWIWVELWAIVQVWVWVWVWVSWLLHL